MSEILHIALRDGFAGERVVVRVAGETVFDRSDVLTDMRKSRAAAFELPLTQVPVEVEVSLPERDGDESARLRVEELRSTWVGVDARGGEVRLTVSSRPFGYL